MKLPFSDYFKDIYKIKNEKTYNINISNPVKKSLKKDTSNLNTKANFFSGVNDYRGSLSRVPKRVTYLPQEVDLGIIATIHETESILRQYEEKIIQRMFREDYTIISDNQKIKDYIDMRISVLEEIRGITFKEVIERMARDLIKFGNVFVEKVRNKNAPESFWRFTQNGRLVPPTVVINSLYPPSMRIAVNKDGRPLKYKQRIEKLIMAEDIDDYYMEYNEQDKYPTWHPDDIIHYKIGCDDSFVYGVPPTAPVIDDVKALRAIEESGELIVHLYSAPIFVFRASATLDHMDSRNEDIRDELEYMKRKGFIIVQNDEEVKYVGANQQTIDITPYFKWFYDRVIKGLGLDSVTMGEGGTSNRNTATAMTEGMIFLVEYFRNHLTNLIENYIFGEWLQEAGIVGKVDIFFTEIDMTSKQAKETHLANLFNNNLITHGEFRNETGRDPINDNSDLLVDRINIYGAEKEAQINNKYQTNGKISSTATSSEKNKKKTSSTEMPHGKPRPKVKKDDYEEEYYE